MDFFDVVSSQRAVRDFSPEPVPHELVRTVLTAAGRAPSGTNAQPWRWIVLEDLAVRRSVAELVRTKAFNTDEVERMLARAKEEADPSRRALIASSARLFSDVAAAPLLVVACLCDLRSPVPDMRTLLAGSSIFGAVQNLMLAARAVGLGTVLTTFHQFFESELRELIDIPDNAVPVCIIPMGFPLNELSVEPNRRKSAESLTFWNRWDDPARFDS